MALLVRFLVGVLALVSLSSFSPAFATSGGWFGSGGTRIYAPSDCNTGDCPQYWGSDWGTNGTNFIDATQCVNSSYYGYYCNTSFYVCPTPKVVDQASGLSVFGGGTFTCKDATPPPPPECSAGVFKTFKITGVSVTPPASVCTGGCEYGATGQQGNVVGDTTYAGYASDGSQCSQDTPNVDPNYSNSCASNEIQINGHCYGNTPGNCPAGESYGTFNGKPMCVDVPPTNCGTVNGVYTCVPSVPDTGDVPPASAPADTNGSNPQSPGHDTGTCPAGQPDCGTGSGSSSGSCDPAIDAGCVASGGAGATGTNNGTCPAGTPNCGAASGSVPGKCDPSKDSGCTPSSVSGGTCSADTRVAPSCTGDAVACAIQLNTWNTACDSSLSRFTPDQSLQDAGRSLFNDGVPSSWSSPSTTADFTNLPSQLDASGSGFGGDNASCPAPVSVSVFGRSFAFSYQFICDWAAKLHGLIVFLGYLSASFIIFRFVREV